MPKPLQATMPALVLNYGCRVVLEARDETTGDLVSGVVLRDIAIYGLDVGGASDDTLAGPFMLVPGPNDGDGA